MSLWQQLQQVPRTAVAPVWHGTLVDYIDTIIPAHPHSTDTAAQRLWAMVEAAGITPGKISHYHFFDNILFGVDEHIHHVMQFFKAAAFGLSLKQRILLLVGAPGSGKSTLATALKEGLERYTQTEDGQVFAIAGCPLHEDPLNALPDELWDALSAELKRPGMQRRHLCPACQQRFVSTDFADIPVTSLPFSSRSRVGIGTYTPPDPQDASDTDLVGQEDLALLSQYGGGSDPRAYRFDGEFNVANRGLMEFVEMLKAPTQHLYPLLTLSQEQQLKTHKFGFMDIDEVVISHTNFTEYHRFAGDKKNEALIDRMFVVQFPYPLRFPEEERVYQKLWTAPVHTDPHLFEVMAVYATMTRVTVETAKKDDNISALLDKVLWYGGRGENKTAQQREKYWEEQHQLYPQEGLSGLSPRRLLDVLDPLATTASCVSTHQFLLHWVTSLKSDHHMGMSKTETETLLALIEGIRTYYNDMAREDLQETFLHAFADQAETLFKQYIEQISALVAGEKIQDPFTGEWKDPDTKFVRSIEDTIGVTAMQAEKFRAEVLSTLGQYYRAGNTPHWDSYPRLAKAFRQRLFQDSRQLLRTTFTSFMPDEKQSEKLQDVKARLISERGYCDVCAQSLLDYAPQLFNE